MNTNDALPQAAHPLDGLIDFARGTLGPDAAARVADHLRSCGECRLELEAWRRVAAAAQARAAEVALPAGLGPAIAERIGREALDSRRPAPVRPPAISRQATLARRLAWLRSFVLAQAPLVRREIWPASAVLMTIGAAISLLDTRGSVPGAALALFAPLAAALGIALIYGQENDPALELAVATPTSPRLVVVARLVIVLAWDLALALGATLLLAVLHGPAVFLPLVSGWLGPMLLLGCLTLLLSLFVGSSAAIVAAAVLWALRAVELSSDARLQQLSIVTSLLDALWRTTPITLAAAAVLLLVALAFAPARTGLAPRPAQ